MNELNEIQYDILSRMSRDWSYCFRHFDDLPLTRKELSKEFKILREARLVFFSNGLMTEDGEVCGSGYGLDNEALVEKLIEDWEIKNLPPWEGKVNDE